MPDKNIGFSRTIYFEWLEAVAELCLKHDDLQTVRHALDVFLAPHVAGAVARRKTIDVLVAIWYKTAFISPPLHTAARAMFAESYTDAEHLWLHYGLAVLYYPIFRRVAAILGQKGRLNESVTRAQVKSLVAAEWGHLGGLDRSVERICASLTQWGVLVPSAPRSRYQPKTRAWSVNNPSLEEWLLACALHAHPADSLPVDDLVRLPELFPFVFHLRASELARSPWFHIYHEGEWHMVSLAF